MDNIQRSKGRSTNYKFDRGGMPTEFGPFIGVVKNNIDAARSGRLQVYIEQFAGKNPNDKNLWRTVMYVPPFYGVTPRNNATTSAGAGNYKGNQQSYGMWFTPPDIGVKVICFFVEGDPNQGYYIGCVPEPGVSHMIPAVGATSKYVAKNAQQTAEIAASGGTQMPVVEINNENPATYENPRFVSQPKPIHDYVYAIMYNQGLLGDNIRGPISSSSQRESPSSVFGMSTPGRPIYQGGLTEKDIKEKLDAGTVKLSDIKVEGRRGGHSIVMDDGDLRGRDDLIRIRTAKGHQITMSDEADCFYFVTANGQTWIELGSEGTVDVFSTNSVNVRSLGEINLQADKNININAGENLNIRAKNIQIESQETTKISSSKDFTLYSKTKLGLLSDGTLALQSNSGGWKTSGGLGFKASRIDLNGGPAPDSVDAPKPIQAYKLDDTKLVAGKGWQVESGTLDTIVPRAPTHEPYPYHNKGVAIQVDVSAQSSTAPTPAVQSTLTSVAALPVTTPSAATGLVNTATASVTNVQAALTTATGSPPGVAAGINAAAVLATPIADVKIGSLSTAQVTGLLAQTKSAVGQASGVISVDKGIGQFGLSADKLEAAGLLKQGTVSAMKAGPAPIPTAADIALAQKIVSQGGSMTPQQVAMGNKINAMLASPTVWTGQSGCYGLTSLLGNDKLQSNVQQNLMVSSLAGLKSSGIATGTESPQQFSGLLQAATNIGVGPLATVVKGIASADVKSAVSATIKGAQFATKFVDDKIGQFAGFAKTATSATNTVDRTVLDQQVKNSLGDTKIPVPEFKPVVRVSDSPSSLDAPRQQLSTAFDKANVWLAEIQTAEEAIYRQYVILDNKAVVTQAEIDAIASQASSALTKYDREKSTYVAPLTTLATTVPADLTEEAQTYVDTLNRYIRLVLGIAEAIKLLKASLELRAKNSV